MVQMRLGGRFLLLAALLAADFWLAGTLWNAVTVSDGHGSIFWSAVALITLIFLALLWATGRVAQHTREISRSR